MTFATLTPEERAELECLCAWLSTQKSDVFKNPHTILAVALRAPQDTQLRDTLADCQDFLSAISEATQGAGQIDGNSILRPGERMRTTAKKLAAKARKALDNLCPTKPAPAPHPAQSAEVERAPMAEAKLNAGQENKLSATPFKL